ncbi:MAG: ion channel [Planctomycetota bacterium]|jgi:hypothetical protein
MISLFLLLLFQPIFQGSLFGGLFLSVGFTFIGVSSALSVFKHRRLFIFICFLAIPCVVLNWLTRLVGYTGVLDILTDAMLIPFAGALVVILLANILTTPVVTAKTLCRAVSGYILIGLVWASAYELLVLVDPEAIPPLGPDSPWADFVYLSFTTLTTLGIGDITPVSPYARSLATVESIVGPMYLAILLARLVAMYRRAPAKEQS